MPVFWFNVDAPIPPQVLVDRLRSVVTGESKLSKFFGSAWASQELRDVPFIGDVRDDSFTIRRNIHYRNSFLPRISGRIVPTLTGARVQILMYVHPFVGLFMVLFLTAAGHVAFTKHSTSGFPPWGLFAFGIALLAGGFFLEAVIARRKLTAVFLNPGE